MPALLEEGISVLQPTVSINGKNYVRTLLLHESGESLHCDTEIVVAKQNDPQAQGSGISYARRYGLQSFVNLGSEDDDGERAMGRGKPVETKEERVAAPAEAPKKAASFRNPANRPVENKVEAPKQESSEEGWDN